MHWPLQGGQEQYCWLAAGGRPKLRPTNSSSLRPQARCQGQL
jgi:hypothetical protein